MRSHSRHTTRCAICSCREVRTDEVFEHGPMILAQCTRCEHRWTARREPAGEPIPIRTQGSPTPVDVKVAA